MKIHKDTACKVTLIGYLEGVPLVHKGKITEDIITFLVTRAKPNNYTEHQEIQQQTEWYRVYIKRNNALNLELNGHPGMKLLVEGDVNNCRIENHNGYKFIVTEIFANKISCFTPEQTNQHAIHEDDAEIIGNLRNYCDVKILSSDRMYYVH